MQELTLKDRATIAYHVLAKTEARQYRRYVMHFFILMLTFDMFISFLHHFVVLSFC